MRLALAPAIACFTLALTSCATTRSAPAQESYVQTPDGALLHFRKLGSGPETVLVPGECWVSPDMDHLADERTVIFYDLRRRGRSGKAAIARFDQDLEDLEAVRTWFGLERFTLLGFDYQAALAAHYAARNPERVERLVLVSPIPSRKFPYWDIYDRVFHDRIDDEAFENLRQLQVLRTPKREPEVWAEAYKQTILSGMVRDASSLQRMEASPLVEPNLDPGPARQQYLGLLAALGDWDWREAFGDVACPTLIVHGTDDPIPPGSAREWAAAIAGARVEAIQKSGRLPWIEQPRAFRRAVDGFLDESR